MIVIVLIIPNYIKLVLSLASSSIKHQEQAEKIIRRINGRTHLSTTLV